MFKKRVRVASNSENGHADKATKRKKAEHDAGRPIIFNFKSGSAKSERHKKKKLEENVVDDQAP